MPPLPSPGAVIKVRLGYTIGEDLTAGTGLFYAYTGGPPDAGDLESIVGNTATNWTANMQAMTQTSTSLTSVKATDLSSDMGAEFEATYAIAGDRSGTLITANTPACINYRIARRYRGGKPKSFVPAGTVTDLENPQTWTSEFVTELGTAWQNFFSGISGITVGTTTVGGLVNVSYYEGFTSVTNPITLRTKDVPKLRTVPVVDEIQSILVDQFLGSQRRRIRA